eukprot:232731_1
MPTLVLFCSHGCAAYIDSDDKHHLHFNNFCENNPITPHHHNYVPRTTHRSPLSLERKAQELEFAVMERLKTVLYNIYRSFGSSQNSKRVPSADESESPLIDKKKL